MYTQHEMTGELYKDGKRLGRWKVVDELNTLRAEADALAAHVEAGREAVEHARQWVPQHVWTRLWLWREEAPTTSLARRDAHPDDLAVDRFTAAMKEKLAAARAKGRAGWDDPERCSAEFLADLLVGHVSKGNAGNMEDIANLAMMLHQRGEDTNVVAQALDRRKAGWQAEVLEGVEAAGKSGRVRPDQLVSFAGSAAGELRRQAEKKEGRDDGSHNTL